MADKTRVVEVKPLVTSHHTVHLWEHAEDRPLCRTRIMRHRQGTIRKFNKRRLCSMCDTYFRTGKGGYRWDKKRQFKLIDGVEITE